MGLSLLPQLGELCPSTGKGCLTKGQAKKIAKRPGKSKGRGGIKMTAYQCRACGKWHVGASRPREVRDPKFRPK